MPRSLLSLALALAVVAGSGAPAQAARSRRAAPDADAAFSEAKRAFQSLRRDPVRRQYRDRWLAVVEKFEAVAQNHPRSPRAADALYDAAELYSELSRVSLARKDLRKAIAAYRQLCERYPRSSLVDDARMALALIYQERLGDLDEAAEQYRAAAAVRGDQRTRATRAIAALEEEARRERSGQGARPTPPNAPRRREPEKQEKPERAIASAGKSRVEESGRREPEKQEKPERAIASAGKSRVEESAARPQRESPEARAPVEAARAERNQASSARSSPSGLPAAQAKALESVEPSPSRAENPKQAAPIAEAATPAPQRAPPADLPEPTVASAGAAPEARVAVAEAPMQGTGDEEEDEDAAASPEQPGAAALDPAKVKALQQANTGGVPLSVQVGLKVRRIVIDPGHGGHDGGAVGPTGLREKDVTLALAQRLERVLSARGYEVSLTRDHDRFVSLDDRARRANRAAGDLFVSLHCNAHRDRRMRGTETYTLNVTADRYAIRLAARENASTERKLSDLQFILADLATKTNTAESVRLAKGVQSELVEANAQAGLRVRNLGVKQALFYVLLGVKMPSVLVETAFISNPDDERRLRDPQHQQRLAEAIAGGIDRFTAERDVLASVDFD